MELIDILLAIVLILFLRAVNTLFFEDIDVDAEISEWIHSKNKGETK